jgi:uncharacterized RDD family membrane protein YckC
METPREPGNLQRPGQEDPGAVPMPGGPEAPVPGGPQAPGPEAPSAPPRYGGPEPPGGWHQPLPGPPALSVGDLAGWWQRVAAYLIDALVVGIPATAIFAGLIALGIGAGDSTGGIVAVVVTILVVTLAVVVVAFLYAPLLMRRPGERNGQTWGKQALGIRVIRTNGLPFDLGSGVFREVVLKGLGVGIASSFFMGVPAALNYLWPLWDDDNRAVHDIIAQTRVVRA